MFSTFSVHGRGKVGTSAQCELVLPWPSAPVLSMPGPSRHHSPQSKMKTPQTAFQSSCRLLISTSGTWFQARQSVLCVNHTIPSHNSVYQGLLVMMYLNTMWMCVRVLQLIVTCITIETDNCRSTTYYSPLLQFVTCQIICMRVNGRNSHTLIQPQSIG